MPLRAMRGLRWRNGNLIGEGIARSPDGPVCEGLALPDRDGLFQRVDQPAACFEGLCPMRRGDHDEDTGFADLDAAEPVNDRRLADGEAAEGFGGQLLHLLR